MKSVIMLQNRRIPVFYSNADKKAIANLAAVLESKLAKGKRALKQCFDTLISIEIVGSEAILHTINENHTLALSLY